MPSKNDVSKAVKSIFDEIVDSIPVLKNKFDKNKPSEEEIQKATIKNWMPVRDVIDDIVLLKDGTYIKIIEVVPINFKLKSKSDKRFLIFNYRAFLKACGFPMQISIQCKKADVEPHIKKIKSFLKIEKNENVKHMMKGYIKLVSSLSYGTKTAISRKFYIIYPYILPPGMKEFIFSDVQKQLNEKYAMIREFLSKCGNDVINIKNRDDIISILYSYFNKKTSLVQKINGKVEDLTGMFLNSKWDDNQIDEEDE